MSEKSEGMKLRAVSIPVAGPIDGEWADLRVALRQCWKDATILSNWAVRELAKADVAPVAEGRLPAMPKVYLYGLAKDQGMALADSKSRSSILRAVEKRYRKRRLAARGRFDESLPSYRYPVPYPVHNQAWKAELGDDGEAIVSLRLGGRRWRLRLRGGHQFRRQLATHRRIAAGELKQGELSLYEVPAESSDHRPQIDRRTPGGGNRRPTRLMVKLTAWMPVESRVSEGTLHVRTDPDSFWVYHVGNEGEPRFLHADQLRRWVAEHRRRLRRMSDDLKHEKRWPKRVRRRMVEAQDRRCRKQRDRVDSFCHEASAMLAAFAARHRVATVVYDDTCKSYVESFPWAMVRGRLAYKLEDRGIAFEHVERECQGDDAVA